MSAHSRIVLTSFGKVATKSVAGSLCAGKARRYHTQSMITIAKMLDSAGHLFVCGVRDFISRNMSYFFQIMTAPASNDVKCSSNDYRGERCYLGDKNSVLEMPMEDLIRVYFSEINHSTALTWFIDFFELIGFDMKKESFPGDLGHCEYSIKNNNTLILYRLDAVDEMILSKTKMFCRHQNKNISSQKWYAEKYKEFKSQITFPWSYLNEQIDNDVMSFFYTPQERAALKQKYNVLGR